MCQNVQQSQRPKKIQFCAKMLIIQHTTFQFVEFHLGTLPRLPGETPRMWVGGQKPRCWERCDWSTNERISPTALTNIVGHLKKVEKWVSDEISNGKKWRNLENNLKIHGITGWPLVGNEGMKPYMVMMGMNLPSFPTKGQPDYEEMLGWNCHM